MTIVCISDTHEQHGKVKVPPGDVLIHAGDLTEIGGKQALIEGMRWLNEQPHKYKLFVPGNHDGLFGVAGEDIELQKFIEGMFPSVMVLRGRGVQINGLNFFGKVGQPWLGWPSDFPKNDHNGRNAEKNWSYIPLDTHILVTHCPPQGILDYEPDGHHVGCPKLLERLDDLRELKAHIFGHIHNSYGTDNSLGHTSVNAAQMNAEHKIQNSPIVFEL